MFWENFLANFLSDVLIIILFGSGTYFLFRNKINKIIINLKNMTGIVAGRDNITLNVDNRTFNISGTKDSSVIQSEEDIKNILKNQ